MIAIVDWREVPTWSEFEIIQSHFQKEGVTTVLADPRDLVFAEGRLTAHGQRIDLVYRRVLINDIVARRAECAALVNAYTSGAVCVANAFTCKIPHKKAFFAVLTDEQNSALFSAAERELIRAPHSLDAPARRHENHARRRIFRPARIRAPPPREFRAEAQ